MCTHPSTRHSHLPNEHPVLVPTMYIIWYVEGIMTDLIRIRIWVQVKLWCGDELVLSYWHIIIMLHCNKDSSLLLSNMHTHCKITKKIMLRDVLKFRIFCCKEAFQPEKCKEVTTRRS